MAIQNAYLQGIYADLIRRHPDQKEYLQAVSEFLESIEPVVEKRPEIEKYAIVERCTEPERVFKFPIPWVDDNGKTHVNHGIRIQYSTALGPSKGGIRFHSTVNESIIKFLGFEMVYKNSLTGLPLGGGKGGSDFDPHGKSDDEVMRFCQSFMNALYSHLGPNTDVPAGDVGVGGREIGYLFGQYKKLSNQFDGTITGKGVKFGGSLARTEATGYGVCYFANAMLTDRGMTMEGKRVIVSGSGNVAIYANEKATSMGAKVVAMSDSNGYIYDPNGIDAEIVKEIKEIKRDRIKTYVNYVPTAEYHENSSNIWTVPADIAMPCATQNEIDEAGAKALVANGCIAVVEGANMPTTPEGIAYLQEHGVLLTPSKASNAGGVSVSSLEMTQNAEHLYWTFEEVDGRLKGIMENIYHNLAETAKEYGLGDNLVKAANICAFERVADAMLAQGLV